MLTTWHELVAEHPKNAKIVSSERSFGDCDIKGINIFGLSGSVSKPVVIFHSMVHAHEWIVTVTMVCVPIIVSSCSV